MPKTPQKPADPSARRRAAPNPKARARDKGTGDPRGGERIAKVLARAGVASRRAAESMIAEGRVAVNGATIDSPALNVGPRDRITVDGAPIGKPEPIRMWIYHKPAGLVTSERDEKGRPTVFDALPEGLPRVVSIGRLDLNSEGLLLLTNDGGLKRRLELPATGWLRKYRVRVKGRPTDEMLEPLRKGITLDGERFQPMLVTIDKQQGANAWLTVGIREGRNREIRRAMESVGLSVNRLIRIAYGPFQLGDLAPGMVEELRPRVLRDQLGLSADEVAESRATPPAQPPARRKGPARAGAAPAAPAASAAEKPARKSWGSKSVGGAMIGGKVAGEKVTGEKAGAGGRANPKGPKSWGAKSAGAQATTPRRPKPGR